MKRSFEPYSDKNSSLSMLTSNGQNNLRLGKLLPGAPQDGITSLSFADNNNQLLLATSWDKKSYIYNIETGRQLSSFEHQSALLTSAFADASLGFAGGVDGRLHKLELNKNVVSIVGTHTDAIKCIKHSSLHNVLLSAGWDSKMKVWDFRSKLSNILDIELRGKGYSLDAAQNKIIVAEAERLVSVFDIRKMSEPVQRRRSPLKLATRCIRINPRCEGFVLSSIEGRIAVDTFDPDQSNSENKFILKAHYRVENEIDHVYPVNVIAFDKSNGDLISGGGDGVVSRWNLKTQERINSITGYPTSIADTAVTTDGQFLAVASSYTWEEGNRAHPPDQIYIYQPKKSLGNAMRTKSGNVLVNPSQSSLVS